MGERHLLAAAVLVITAVSCGSAEPHHADGALGAKEWANSTREELVGGGDVRFQIRGKVLSVVVTGPARGIASLCVGDRHRVSILHASAALGTARYRQSVGGWSLLNGFDWKVRDSSRSGPPSTLERQRFLEDNRWVANPSQQGSPVREFEIHLLPEHQYLGIAFLSLDTMKVAYWPRSMADDCRSLDLIKGNPPRKLGFAPETWYRVDR